MSSTRYCSRWNRHASGYICRTSDAGSIEILIRVKSTHPLLRPALAAAFFFTALMAECRLRSGQKLVGVREQHRHLPALLI